MVGVLIAGGSMTSKTRRSQMRRSALTTETDSHVGDACPYLGLYADPRTHYAFPSRANCCHTHEPALLIDLDYQSAFCLSDRWPTCPLYETARRRGVRRSRLHNGRGWLLVAGMVTAVAVLAVLFLRLWLNGALPFPSPLATVPPTAGAPLAEGGTSTLTPTPSPSSAPTSTPSPRPASPGPTAVAVVPATQAPGATEAPTVTWTVAPASTSTVTRTSTVTPTSTVTLTSTVTPTLPPATSTHTATSTPTSPPPPPTATSTATPPPPTPTEPPPSPTNTPPPTQPPPTPTPTATTTPTATLPPTPTPAATYPAPVLVAPADGQSFGPNDTVMLEWRSVGALSADAFYAITVEYGHLGETWYDETPRVRDTRWALSEHRYLLDLANNGRFRWWVQVMRQTGVDASGSPVVVAASPPSEPRVVFWRGESPAPPVSTPAPPPA